jgi:2-keto-4-pentenoate hydratase
MCCCGLVNHQSARGKGLTAGEIVSTGTCTGLDSVHPGDVARADFGALGMVEIDFKLHEYPDDGLDFRLAGRATLEG